LVNIFSLCIFLHDMMWGGTIGQFFDYGRGCHRMLD
jgi:hypothetical protein